MTLDILMPLTYLILESFQMFVRDYKSKSLCLVKFCCLISAYIMWENIGWKIKLAITSIVKQLSGSILSLQFIDSVAMRTFKPSHTVSCKYKYVENVISLFHHCIFPKTRTKSLILKNIVSWSRLLKKVYDKMIL